MLKLPFLLVEISLSVVFLPRLYRGSEATLIFSDRADMWKNFLPYMQLNGIKVGHSTPITMFAYD